MIGTSSYMNDSFNLLFIWWSLRINWDQYLRVVNDIVQKRLQKSKCIRFLSPPRSWASAIFQMYLYRFFILESHFQCSNLFNMFAATILWFLRHLSFRNHLLVFMENSNLNQYMYVLGSELIMTDWPTEYWSFFMNLNDRKSR